ncbi:MAG: hypothetical protein WCP04_14655 [Pseudomonadota bacterium]|jgi:8-oxo-dGTP pyrophosphatase MutT (NUDIX family)
MTDAPTDPVTQKSTPIAAATLALLREGSEGPEVLMIRRRESLAAFGGLWVFPGGKLEAADRVHAEHLRTQSQALELAQNTAQHSTETLPSRLAALRETFEETGLLLATSSNPSFTERYQRHVADWRVGVTRDAFAFQSLLRAEQAHLAIETLAYWTRWLPPSETPKRFDTDFYVACAPDTQAVVVDASESIEYRWLPFDDAESIATHCAPVTLFMLLHLRLEYDRHGSVAALLSAALQRTPRTVTVRRGVFNQQRYAVFPWDAHYAALSGEGEAWAESERASMHGLPSRLTIRDGLFKGEDTPKN